MRCTLILIFELFILLLPPANGSSFHQDVIMGSRRRLSARKSLNGELLAKAVKLDEYRKRMIVNGYHFPNEDSGSDGGGDSSSSSSIRRRHLDDNGNNYYYNYNNNDQYQAQTNDDQKNEDDYYVNEENYLNFDGYSLKYAKCQPVQRFSQNAVEAGEYSPMVVNDIVIMRLCPSAYCSDSRAYGCSSDFVEYAIELTDYIRIMLRYNMDKEEKLCNWCNSCEEQNRRRVVSYDYYYDEDGNLQKEQRDDDGKDDDYIAYGCDDYESYCLNDYGNSICNDSDDDQAGNGYDDYNNNNYISSDEYLDIIDCTQLDGGYFIRPRCDAYTEILSIGIYHDRFCSNYAGNEVDIETFDLGIDQTYFQKLGGSAGCLNCSESDSPPNLYANANLCNRIDVESSRCTSSSSSISSLFASNDTNFTYDDQTDCSFIESVRYGTYDADGQLYFEGVFGTNNRKVTTTQISLLVLCLMICFLLAIYACCLHHAITNVLIKSLNHTDLLSPSKFRKRLSTTSGSRRKGRKNRRKPADDDEEKNIKGSLT